MLIALIDDGIETSGSLNLRVKYDLSVGDDCVVRARDVHDRIITDHGTTCARIIAKYAPNAEFCSLRIFHQPQLRTSCQRLAAAMKWCLVARVPIVHLSLGSSQPSDYKQLRSLAASMLQQRQVIVAACSNAGVYSVPAGLSGVLGVIADQRLKDDEYRILPGDNRIRASSRHRLAFPSGRSCTTQITNSYAAPTVTAAVHNVFEASGACSMSALQVYARLAGDANIASLARPDFVEDAIILNPSGVPVLKQHLFFNCLAERIGPLCSQQFGLRNENIVYLVPQSTEYAQPADHYLREQAHRSKSLLYGGTLPQGEEHWLSSGLVWSEDCCRYPLDLPGQGCEERPAVINLYGQGTKAIDVLCQLRNLFIADEYQCRGLCDFPYAYLYDLEFVPPGISAESAIASITQMVRPEVVIQNYQLPAHAIAAEQGAYSIVMADGDRHEDNLAENQSYLSLVVDQQDIWLTYKRILSYFTQETAESR